MAFVFYNDSRSSLTRIRGSSFLKKWMAFLEEDADLRYPDVTTLEMGV